MGTASAPGRRGPYRNYSFELKELATAIARYQPVSMVSNLLNIPSKNIKRWINKGIERSKGGGRKPAQPELEEHIYRLIRQGKVNTRREVQEVAKQLAAPGFKASKGWLIKFMRRHKLTTITIEEKMEEEQIYLFDSEPKPVVLAMPLPQS